MNRVKLSFFEAVCAMALAAVMVAATALCALAAERECKIAIVKSWDLPEYNTALEGFSEVMSKQGVTCETVIYKLKGQLDPVEDIEKIRAFKPDLILTVGSRATSVILKNFQDTPVVFSMVLYPVASEFVSSIDKPGDNVTGAAVDVPIERQLRTLSKIVPNLKRVGVLYSPEETLPVIEEAKRIAKSMNIQLVAEQVNSESDVPRALKKLQEQGVDALWSVADGKVFTSPSTKYIIEQTVRSGLPFMGPYNGFVRAGALVALTADYRDNGRQAAEIAIRILNGVKPANIPVVTPRNVQMAINLRVANSIGLKINPSIVNDASQVFE
jgi:putative ABC transport system substrate-binding protein